MKARLFSCAIATVLLLVALSSPGLGQSSDTLAGDPTIELTYLRGKDRFDALENPVGCASLTGQADKAGSSELWRSSSCPQACRL